MAARQGPPVRWGDLATAIKQRLVDDSLTLGEAAAQIGLSTASLSRIVNRKTAPSSDSFALLTRWLGVPPQRFLAENPEVEMDQVAHYAGESTPEVVLAHLRADKHLSPETAQALSEAFNALYQHYARRTVERTQHEGM